VRACTTLTEMCETAETAVFDAGSFQLAGATGVLLVTGGTRLLLVLFVSYFKRRAYRQPGSLKGCNCRPISRRVLCQIDDLAKVGDVWPVRSGFAGFDRGCR
jgi:hypothetical protein